MWGGGDNATAPGDYFRKMGPIHNGMDRERERERAMSDGGAARRARVETERGSEAAEGNGEKSRKFL